MNNNAPRPHFPTQPALGTTIKLRPVITNSDIYRVPAKHKSIPPRVNGRRQTPD